MASPCPHCGSTEGLDHLCSAAQMALIGQVLDNRYKIEDVLGQGGMGMVFRATQTSVNRRVAVKTLNPSLAAAPQFFERFRREAEIASRLRHPNVITIYDFGRSQDGTCYYVMELLEGESLRELVKREGPMTLRRAVDVIEQSCRGLAHAHEQNAVHRDIKPHNIMVQQLDGRDFVKVLDFGLVKALEQEEEMQLTSTGQVLGTPQYMPPEQAGGEHVDHRSDLYSMGGVFYYCLTGSSPYGANTVRKALTAVLTQPPPTVGAKRQGAPVPPALEDFFQKALAREKEDRYQSAQEFIDAMMDAVADATPAQLDAVPASSAPEAGAGGKPGQKSVSRPGRSSPSSAKARTPGTSGRGVPAQTSGASGARGTASRAALSSNPNVARASGSASQSGVRPRTGSRPALASLPPPEPEVQEAPRQGWSLQKIMLVAVPLVLISAGGAVVALRSPSSPAVTPPTGAEVRKEPVAAPTPPPAADSNLLLVKLSSTPAGAAVFEGDVQLGTTPLSRKLRRDQLHDLSFKLGGYQEAKRKLNFEGVVEDSQEVSVALDPLKAAPPPETSRPSRPSKPAGKDKDDSVPIFE